LLLKTGLRPVFTRRTPARAGAAQSVHNSLKDGAAGMRGCMCHRESIATRRTR